MQPPICVVNFYKFVEIIELNEIQTRLQAKCDELLLRGSILLASDGINGSLGGSSQAIDTIEAEIHQIPQFADVVLKRSYGTTIPFSRMKVKIKDSILTFDEKTQFEIDDFAKTKRLSPEEWQQALEKSDDEYVLLDTRNDYEVAYGAFEGATHLGIRHFNDFQDRFLETYKGQENKKFLMYCTGGIRCEKVTAFAEKHGFEHCYQLDGGIVGYFEKQGKAHWNGSCFVFDFRWAISSDLKETGEGHYLEDGFRGSVHNVPEKAATAQKQGLWPKEPSNPAQQ